MAARPRHRRRARHPGGVALRRAARRVRAFAYAGTVQEALRQLDEAYGRWTDGVRGLDAAGLARPCGPAEGPFADHPMAALVLHINREVIHHGAEVALLRDLYRPGPADAPQRAKWSHPPGPPS